MAADLQSHSQYWKSFNLVALQKELDVTANDLAARQDESDNSRKKLVEQSREFKKVTAEDIRKQVAPLLKSFQVEVDSLSKRSKAAEAAFLTIYKRLIDVPDPLPALEQALTHQKLATRLSDYEIENTKLRETLAEYNSEFAEVKSQELTIKQLKERIRDYESRIETEVQTRSAGQEKELNRQFQEKEKQLHETQLSFAKKLGIAEHQMTSLRTALEASQSEMFELKSKLEHSAAAKSDEMEMLISDLERANERATLAERQVENLKEQLAKLQGSLKERDTNHRELDVAIDEMKRSNLELELTAKEKEITQLVEEVQKLQAASAKQQAEFHSRVSRLEDELARRAEQVTTLDATLSQQSDYEEIRKELEIMKSLEFSNTDNSEAGLEVEKTKSLETLLLEKNRSFQTENTKLKNSNLEVIGRCDSISQQFNDSVKMCQEQKSLIGQLEDDLRKVNALSIMFRGDAEGEPSQSTELVAEAVKGSQPVDPGKVAAADSLLPIMHGQRERYRQRAQELETEMVALQQKNLLQQNEMDRIRTDNIKLYEKIKFLQNYSSQSGSRSSAGTGDDTEARYSAQYEMKLDPFTHFNRKERSKRYGNLKLHEKITLGIGRMVMGNPTARTFAFIYAILLHLLVFLSLYKMANMDEAATSNQCHERFAEHMLAFHKDGHDHRL